MHRRRSLLRLLLKFILILFFSLLSQAAQKPGDETTAIELMKKALALETQGKFNEALVQYQEVLKAPGSLAEYAHLFSARIALQIEQVEQAKLHFEKILDLSPNLQLQNETQFQLGKIALRENKPIVAKKIFLSLEKKNRREAVYPELLWELAQTEKSLGVTSGFCQWFKKLYISRPDDEHVRAQTLDPSCQMSLDERRRRIKNLQWLGLSQKAWNEIQDMKSIKEEDPFDVIMLEASYFLHEGEVSEALNRLLPQYEQKKTNFNYLTTLAIAAARSGDLQLAVGSYYTASKLAPKSKSGREALYQAAFMSYQFQDYDGAARKFQEVLKLYPSSGLSRDAKWHLSWIRYLRGDYVGAFKAFNELKNMGARGKQSRVTTEDRLQYWMAMSLFRQGKYVEAKEKFESILCMGGQSYYALASQQRLKKVEPLLPKPVRPILNEQNQRLARISSLELMTPSDEYGLSQSAKSMLSEENESEETLALNPLVAKVEQPDDAIAVEDADQAAEENNSIENSNVAVEDLKLSSPILNKRFERARELMTLGLGDWAKWDLYDIERKTVSRDHLKRLISEYESIEQFHRSSSIAQNSFAGLRAQYGIGGVRDLWQKAYPQAYQVHVKKWSQELQVPTNLIWGIMKAESSYKRDVVSPVGAIGLMQIMPNTGKQISDLLKEKSFLPQMLFKPEVSIHLGTKYLQRLGRQFDQNPALIAAGYNAGPHRVRGWLATFGQLDLDEFIEHIPFLETRNYVKRVLSNSWVYNQLYNQVNEPVTILAEPLKIKFLNLSSTKETWEDI